jgi:coatomer subunit beta'
LLSGGDDSLVKLWDYQTKQCLFTFDGHADNISAVAFHPELPILISAAEDGKVNVWNSISFELETNINYGLDRAWSIHAVKNSNYVALAYDEATVVIKIGKETPIVSFNNGRVICAKQGEVQLANFKTIKDDLLDGEEVVPKFKELGNSEIYAQDIKFSPNGRYFALCGDSDYVIYSTHKFQNSGFGHATGLVWGSNNDYAAMGDNNVVKIFKDFAETNSFKTTFKPNDIFGGKLIGVSSKQGAQSVSFYDWDTFTCIRRIDVECPKNVYWSISGEYVVIILEEFFYVLRYNASVVAQAVAAGVEFGDEGIEDAFTFLGDYSEEVVSGEWVAHDAFVFTTAKGKLNYLIGDKIINHALIDKKMFVLGYVAQQNKLYLVNKSLKMTSYELFSSVMQAQREIVDSDPTMTPQHPDYPKLKETLDAVPESHKGKIAKFLINLSKEIAYEVAVDEEFKFDLAISLNKLQDAFDIAQSDPHNYEKLRKVGDISLKIGDVNLAEKSYKQSNDYNSLLLIYSCLGDVEGMKYVAEAAMADKKFNVAFQCYFTLAMPNNCYEILIKADRIPEAAMFARAYLPSKIDHVMKLWKEKSKDKPFVPANLSDIPENLAPIDLAIRIESALAEYYEGEKELASDHELAQQRHFADISQQVANGEQVELSKPLVRNPPIQIAKASVVDVDDAAPQEPETNEDPEGEL